MGTGQSSSTSPCPHSQLGPGCLCSCSGSSSARPQGQPQAQTSSLASWFTTGISHNRPVVSMLRTRWTLLLLFHIHTISLSGSDEQKYMQQISEEDRKEEKRCIFLAHHLDGLLGQCTDKHAIPLKAVPLKPNWIWRTGCYLYYFFMKAFKIPKFLSLLYQRVMSRTLFLQTKGHGHTADHGLWQLEARDGGAATYPHIPVPCGRSWSSREWMYNHFSWYLANPLPLGLLWLMLIHHLESVLAVCTVFHGE